MNIRLAATLPTSNTKVPLLIRGAGIAGLTMAIACEQHRLPFKIIEKAQEPTTEGAGIALPANALDALDRLGLGDKVREIAHHVSAIRYMAPDGELLSEATLTDAPLNQNSFVALPRATLHKILLESVTTSVKYGASTPTTVYPYTIAADGINSSTRSEYRPDISFVDHGVTNWRWQMAFPTEGLEPTYVFGRQKAFMVYPMGDDLVYCYAHAVDPEHTLKETPIKTLFSEYAGIVSAALDAIPADTQIIPGRLRSVSAPVFQAGSVAFIGDASSACSPMLQQGAASAFEDAITLATCISKFGVEDGFSRYEDCRKAHVTDVIASSDAPLKGLINATPEAFEQVYDMVRANGPLNVLGWRKLLANNFLGQLDDYINAYASTEK